jgi:hypothetical protein
VMTAAEKLEQSVTHRPDSYVAGRTLMTLLGGHPGSSVNGYSRTTHTSAGPREVLCICTGSNRSYTPNQRGPSYTRTADASLSAGTSSISP